ERPLSTRSGRLGLRLDFAESAIDEPTPWISNQCNGSCVRALSSEGSSSSPRRTAAVPALGDGSAVWRGFWLDAERRNCNRCAASHGRPPAVRPELRRAYSRSAINGISTLQVSQPVRRDGESLMPVAGIHYHAIAAARPAVVWCRWTAQSSRARVRP